MAIHRERERLAEQTRAVGHPLRLALLARLSETPGMCVCELARAVAAAQPAVSHHLGLMRTAGLLERQRDGGRVAYCIAADAAQALLNGLRAVLVPAAQREEGR